MTDQKKVIEILCAITKVMEENKEFLTDLDNVIGDGDHGINMARGFAEVEKQAEGLAQKDIGNILKSVGMTLVSKVGGSSGPLYGTAFMKAGMLIGDKAEIGIEDFLGGLDAGIEGIKARGKSTAGEKTMLDAMIPALDAMKEKQAAGASVKEILDAGVAAAQAGVEATKPMVATKGRASYLGERSVGHQDPGATSFALLLAEIAKAY
ncbi:MAG: dihydroxyacetone kinase subunit L [Eubacterium sp.]|nr:dihydroxyacetone kinase subunit L [Eubacterium sp.]